MAPTLVASYYVPSAGASAAAVTTPSFTPSNGEVIIVKLETYDTSIAMGAPTGGSQTYTSRITVAPGGFRPWVGIYSATISGSPGSMTVSSTPGALARYSMCVERWSSATLAATPVTNSGGTTNGGAGAAASTLTTSAANSVISWVAGDAQSLDPATRAYLNSATDEGVRDDHVGANGVAYHAYRAVAAAGSTSFGLSAPTGMQWDIAGIEVLASGGAAAPAFVQVPPAHRRFQLPRRMPRVATPVRAQVNPPFPFTGIKQPRRLRGLLARRGEMFAPVPPQVVVAAPVFPPRPVRTRLKGLRMYRGEMFAPPSDQLNNTRQPQRPRLRLPRILRGHTATPVPAQIAVAPPAYPPQSVRTRLRGLRIFRGRAATVVPAQIVVTPPSFTPLAVRTRLRFARLFRGRASAPVPDQLVAPPAPHLRPRGMAPRRGHAAMPVPPQIVVAPPAYPVRPVRPRLKGLRGVRGRQAAMPVPPQVVIVPPKMVPLFTRLKQHAARIFRGESRAVLPPVCDCTTHRPNLGTMTRPSSGMTARPNSGTTSRPCSCND